MAKSKRWWPQTIALQLAFWLNFISKLGTYATALNITTDEITAFGKDAAVFAYLYAYEKVVRSFLASFMAYRKNLLAGKVPADKGNPPLVGICTRIRWSRCSISSPELGIFNPIHQKNHIFSYKSASSAFPFPSIQVPIPSQNLPKSHFIQSS